MFNVVEFANFANDFANDIQNGNIGEILSEISSLNIGGVTDDVNDFL